MSVASISGTISPIGYLHITYDKRDVDGELYDVNDMVHFPIDDKGTVSFTLPQGITARIVVWSEKNGYIVTEKVVTVPKRRTRSRWKTY